MTAHEQSKLRIIAGKWRHRKIIFPILPGLRPTHDRIRETLFNWLAPFIEGANCLDLFAGSGALGFEALSRGAKQVTFVDNAQEVLDVLKQNVVVLGAGDAAVAGQAHLVLGECPQKMPPLTHAPFDIVFLDPPFHQGLVQTTAAWLEENDYLAPEALIYAEAEQDLANLGIPSHWEALREKQTASLAYYLLQRGLGQPIKS